MIETLREAVDALEMMIEREHIRATLKQLIAQLEKQEPVGTVETLFDENVIEWRKLDRKTEVFFHPAPAVPDDFMQQIEQWSQAYPLDIFPELTKEDWKRARRALDGSLVKLDRISASVIRHVITRVKEMLDAAPEYKGEK